MIEVIVSGLAARKVRTLLTAAAVALGVAMISGTFVLMDTTTSAYSQIFNSAYAHTDAAVVAKTPFGATGATKTALPAGLITQIRALPEVQRAHGYIDAHAQLTDAAGTAIGKSSEAATLFGLATDDLDAMNPLTLVRGTWPHGAGQSIVDEATAKANHIGVGATVGLVARTALERYRVVGIFRFAGAQTLGPTQFVALDLPVAQRIFDKQAMVDEIDVAARPDVSAAELIAAIRNITPLTAKVSTAADQAQAATSDVGEQYRPLRYVLLGFGAISLLIGSFIIFNTLSITVAQRTRELATLRTLGASRWQILASILLEGALIGVAASLAGLGVGLGIAKGLYALLASSGIDLPTAGTVLQARTVAVSLAAGITVTLAASLAPALRAMRIVPVVAIRQGHVPPSGRRHRADRIITLALAGLGVGALTPAIVLDGLPATTRLLLLAAGAALLLAGVAGASRWAIAPLAAVIGKPIEALTRTAGELARENTARNPGRTASTAAALTVGVALIVFVAVLAQGLRHSTGASIRNQVSADYVVTAQRDLLSPDVQHTLRAAGISSAGVRSGTVHVAGSNQTMTGVLPADIARFYHFTWTNGSTAASLSTLDATGVLLADDFAVRHHLAIGSTLTTQTTVGTTLHLTVRGIYTGPKLSPLLGAMTVTTSLFDTAFTTPGDRLVYVNIASDGG